MMMMMMMMIIIIIIIIILNIVNLKISGAFCFIARVTPSGVGHLAVTCFTLMVS
jgi:hypothetical protein